MNRSESALQGINQDEACQSATPDETIAASPPPASQPASASPAAPVAASARLDRTAIEWAYRFFLGREAESEEVVQNHLRAHPNITSLREGFLQSDEFRRGFGFVVGASVPRRAVMLPLALPDIEVEYEATEEQLGRCLAKIEAAWSHLGATRPHFSVITDARFRPEHIGDSIDRFWASGEAEARSVQQILARHGLRRPSGGVCVEYGCGVGRVTAGLARIFRAVHAYDISENHLEHARARVKELGIGNVRLLRCSASSLERLEPCDAFYSRLVFQHNPPPVIYRLIQLSLRALQPHGIAIFQVPTYLIGYRFKIEQWLTTEHALDMQMHCLPQQSIFTLIAQEHCELLEIREDDATGAPDRFISDTFIVRKRGSSVSSGSSGPRRGPGGRLRRLIESVRAGARTPSLASGMPAVSPGGGLPNLTQLYPQKYVQLGADASTFWAASNDDFRLMHELIHRHGYYERGGVWNSEIDLDKELIAATVRGLGARSCIEMGCYTGPVLSVLEQQGIEVCGVEVSRQALAHAHPNVAARIRLGDLLDLDTEEKFDVLLGMDILEHLNPLDLDRYVQRISTLVAPTGFAYINSPMFGKDDVFGTVFEAYLPQWRAAGTQDFWRYLHCDAEGWPVHGHLVWASPQWWERLFSARGLVRDRRIESCLHGLLGTFFDRLAPARRSIFVLRHSDFVPEVRSIALQLNAFLAPLTRTV